MRTKVLILLGVLIGLFMAALDQTIVSTALPRVVADLGGFDRFAWVFTAYMLASTTLIPIMGKVSDLFGRKWVIVGGMAIFMLGSALSGAAQTMDQLIIFRASRRRRRGVDEQRLHLPRRPVCARGAGQVAGRLRRGLRRREHRGAARGRLHHRQFDVALDLLHQYPIGAVAIALVAAWMPWARYAGSSAPSTTSAPRCSSARWRRCCSR